MAGKKRILIVGGAGFIGSWLTKELVEKGHGVVIIDPLIYHSGIEPKMLKKIIAFREKKLLKGAKLYKKKYSLIGKKILSTFKPEIVIHLAAIPIEKPEDLSIGEKQILSDMPLTYELCRDVASTESVKKFIYLSSVLAYGEHKGLISEAKPLNPSTLYGISKAMGEFTIKTMLQKKDWVIVRTTSIYGFGDANFRVSQIFVDRALKGQSIWINKDIKPEFTYIKDLVSGLMKIVEKDVSQQIIHMSGGHAVSLVGFVTELKKYFPELKYEIRKNVNDRPKRGTMNNRKAKQLLSWVPKFSITAGLSDYMDYVKTAKHG